ncbi:MAG TPA: 16S rRNA (guanine(527)-N(7))-methyltransferase RsmG, partial [Woeseiaceae bacterium]|nr:16S rRNA (guanine(527)-N(7))-methyltransferase RsmG [Woeseiaceae bacterium]
RDSDAMVAGHVLDSLSVRELVEGPRVIDVGTGAGFPGLPLAIVEPRHHITLIDSNGKKISFVRHMIGELGLDNARATQVRAERFAPESRFDTVITRAFASLPKTLELAGHLLADNGVLLALKGRYPHAELADLAVRAEKWEIEVTEVTVPALAQHSRHIVAMRRGQ